MSAMIDQTPLFLSSGLEDYFLGTYLRAPTRHWMAHTDVVRAVSGAYFHSMPTEHLPYSGFENIQPATAEPEAIATNSLAACAPKPVFGSCYCHSSGPQTNLQAVSDRIHEPDPLLFSSSFEFQWIASSVNRDKNGGFCNCEPIQLRHDAISTGADCEPCCGGQTTGPLRRFLARRLRPTSTALCLWTAWRGCTSGTSSVNAKGLPQAIFPRAATTIDSITFWPWAIELARSILALGASELFFLGAGFLLAERASSVAIFFRWGERAS